MQMHGLNVIELKKTCQAFFESGLLCGDQWSQAGASAGWCVMFLDGAICFSKMTNAFHCDNDGSDVSCNNSLESRMGTGFAEVRNLF